MIVTLVGRLTQFALMFMSLKLMTSLLPPDQIGRAALVTTGIAFFALFLVNPAGMFFNRRLHTWFNSGRARSYTHLYAIYLIVVGLVAVLFSLGAAVVGFNPAGLEWEWIVVLVGGSLFFNTAIQTLIPSLNMLGRELSFTALNVLTLVMSLICSLIFCHFAGVTAEYWIAGTLTGQMIFSCIAYVVFFWKYPTDGHLPSPSQGQITKAIHFCWPVAITVGLQWMQMQGYRFLLADQFGISEFGLFVVGYSVAASLLSAGETILTTWFQPAFYRSINSNDEDERNAAWHIYAGRMLPASLLGVTALITVSDTLPRLMLGNAYQSVGQYVILGAIAEWGRMLVGVFSLNAHRHMETHQLILPNALGACVAAIGFLVCVKIFGLGIPSAPICAAIGTGVVVVTLWRSSKRVDAHMHLNLRGLIRQAMGLLLVTLVTVRLLDYLPYQGLAKASLALAIVGLIWMALAFLMLGGLKIHHTSGSKI